jgi:predicted extracellular nuclease
MTSRPGRAHRRVALLLATLLTAASSAAMLPPAVAAAPTELFFSEYIEGSSNNKALEIYNGTGAAVNLATGGYSIQMAFNGSATPGLTINLTGTVANGDVYVVAQASANATILGQADQTNGAGWFNGDDAVLLRKGTTVIDAVGQLGSDPGAEWGSGLTSTADNTLRRKASVAGGDTIPGDAFDPSAEWDGFAIDTVDGLGCHLGGCETAPEVAGTVPADGGEVSPNASLSVTFSEAVDVTGTWFTLACGTSGSHEAQVSGGPVTFALDPATDFVPGESCTLTIVAAQVTDQDANDPPDNLAVDFVVGFSALDVCTQPFTSIPAIQGSGLAAATTGNLTTQGVVVGDFEGTPAASGFYLQDPVGDGDPATSDGIFVFTGSSNLVSAGQVVRVTGFARERFTQTTINGSNSNTSPVTATNVVACGTDAVAATDVTLPFANVDAPERYEGMLVRFPQDLVISEYFNYDRFGELVLALPLAGEPRPFTGTALDEPRAPANARTAANSLRRITLDDAQSAQNPEVLRHPNGSPFTLDNRFRGGDHVANTVGVLAFDFSLYRVVPTAGADYTSTNPRPAAPEDVGGNVRVAAMNTLNYFLTLDTTASDSGPGPCGGNANLDCRGADADQPDELPRQRTKLLAALAGLDADVIGLNELENTPNVDPSGDLAAGLGGYEAIDTGTIGTDAIKVGLIYRPAVVTPVGAYQTLDTADDPRFIDTKSRPSLAQTFEVNATGARFTVVVNHLKSKGSACDDVGDPDLLDGQGNCSQTRRAAAEALVDWLATDPTGSGDPDFLIVGDLNSYAREQTIDELKAGADDTAGTGDDFVNLINKFQGPFAYSYTFDGQAGYLDHALANRALLPQVERAADWHINSDEPDILDYDTTFKGPAQEALYEPNQFRTSDHDPVVVGLTLLGAPEVADPAVVPEPSEEGESTVASAMFMPVSGDAGDAFRCTVDYGDGSGAVAGTVAGTTCTGPAHAYAEFGTYTVTVTVEDGDEETGSASSEHVVVFAFGGFQSPVDPAARNLAKAGSSVPIRFSLGGDQGLAILAAGSPSSRVVTCDKSVPGEAVEAIDTAGQSGLRYDAATDTYTYVWKTQKGWAGTCRELSLALVDGTTHVALFEFTR